MGTDLIVQSGDPLIRLLTDFEALWLKFRAFEDFVLATKSN